MSAIIRNPDEKRLRALMMLEMRIKKAAGLPEIAREFNVSEKTVQRNLTWARRAGLVADAEDRILKELVPAAHDAILRGLQSTDEEVAGKLGIEVFKGTMGGFQKRTTSNVTSTGGDDLESYLHSLRAEGPNVIEGTVAGEAQRALPAGPEGTAPEGADAPHPDLEPRDEAPAERPSSVGE